jgi:myo-inositol 2-dehydrogenase / D-chiro-inositol 1-dehydrogenase
MIGTPYHWHVPLSLAAVRAGKDVICEKPTLTIAEGRVLADAVKRYGAVFQTSTEDRSLPVYHRMAELVRNQRIGKLRRIYVGLPGGGGAGGPDPTPLPVPTGFDWNMWLGPAPWGPFRAGLHAFNWRWKSDYSGGMLTDWGAHLLDTAQWANDTERSGPIEVEGTGKRNEKGLYDTFHTFDLNYRYASGVEMQVTSRGVELRFEGAEGWVGNQGWIGDLQASSEKIRTSVIGPGETHLFTCPAGEHRNFLDCVKSRREPYFPAEIGHRCCSVAHLGNIALELGRKLRWDPAKEEFANDDQANCLRGRAMREPWQL